MNLLQRLYTVIKCVHYYLFCKLPGIDKCKKTYSSSEHTDFPSALLFAILAYRWWAGDISRVAWFFIYTVHHIEYVSHKSFGSQWRWYLFLYGETSLINIASCKAGAVVDWFKPKWYCAGYMSLQHDDTCQFVLTASPSCVPSAHWVQ